MLKKNKVNVVNDGVLNCLSLIIFFNVNQHWKKKKNYKHPSAILFRQTIFVQSNATIRLKNRYIFFKFKLLRSPKQLFYLIWRIFSSPLVYQNLSIFIESIKLYLKYSALIFCIILTISYMINRWHNNLQFFRDSS